MRRLCPDVLKCFAAVDNAQFCRSLTTLFISYPTTTRTIWNSFLLSSVDTAVKVPYSFFCLSFLIRCCYPRWPTSSPSRPSIPLILRRISQNCISTWNIMLLIGKSHKMKFWSRFCVKQDNRYTFNFTLRRVPATIVAVDKQKYYKFRKCMFVALGTQREKRMSHFHL
jgi:hypothetical protein